MSEERVNTSAHPTVIIEQAGGNLSIRGGDESGVWVQSDREEYSIEQDEDRVSIRLERDGIVHVPTGSTLIVETAHGNAKINDIQGEISIETVHGNLALSETGPLRIEKVHGNLAAHQVHGDVSIERVSGNTALHQVEGNVAVETCQGHLVVRGASGDVQSSVSGSVTLNLSPQPGHTIAIDTRGNITCHIPATTQSQVSLKATGNISVKGLPLPESATRNAFTLGEGTGRIILEAWGNISLRGIDPEADEDEFDFAADMDFGFEQANEMMRQFSEQMEQHARELARQVEERMAGLGSGDELSAKVQEKVQRALRQAEEKIAQAARRAEEKANRQAERAAARAARHGYTARGPMPRHPMSPGVMSPGVVPTPPVPPMPPRPGGMAQGPARPAAPAVSDEERMAILRMLEEGKISVDQAETLLSALEG